MSLTIYEVLCNARYNLENAVFPFQIEMAKEQLANALDAIDNGKTLNDVWEEAQPNAESMDWKMFQENDFCSHGKRKEPAHEPQ